MPHYFGLTPEALLVLAAIVALFADRLGGDRSAAIIGSIATFAAVALVWVVPAPEIMLGGRISLAATPPTLVLRAVIAGLTGLLLIWVAARGWGGKRAREAVAMVLFASAGGMLLVSATDIVVLFVAMELSTMPSYVLAGYSRDDRRGLEGALKYFLLSVLTSLITAYGLSFVYGLSGATDYAHANISSGGVLATVAAMLVLVGLLAKLTVAPFHFWSPDAMAGAPVTSAAYISSIAKIAPMWALVRLLVDVLPTGPGLSTAILIVAVISMTLGILAALTQTDLRRMIAYSGISNAGFMMLGVAAGTAAGYAGAVLLVVFYSVSVLGLLLVVAQEGATLQDVAGLIKRRPYAAWASVAFLFSIIGFPPFIGFYGKLAVFSAALDAGYLWAVVLAVLLSVVAGGYAFNVIRAMFTPGEGAPEEVVRPSIEESTDYRQAPAVAAAVILTLAIITIAVGLATQPMLELLGSVLA